MVGHGNRQDERQHPNVVHGPNPSPHRTGPAQQPNRASPTARGPYATCESQSSVRRKHGDEHRKRHERVVVRTNQVHGSHLTPSALPRGTVDCASIKKLTVFLAPALSLAGFSNPIGRVSYSLYKDFHGLSG